MSDNLVIITPPGVSTPVWKYLVCDYLRPQRPAFAHCYYRAAIYAGSRGEKLPSKSTLLRRLRSSIPAIVVAALRGELSAHLLMAEAA